MLGARSGAVLDFSDLISDDPAAGDPSREKVRRRGARQVAEVSVEVRVVAVARGVGDVSPSLRVGLELTTNVLEAQQPGDRLGRQANLLSELDGQVTPAAAQFSSERLNSLPPPALARRRASAQATAGVGDGPSWARAARNRSSESKRWSQSGASRNRSARRAPASG